MTAIPPRVTEGSVGCTTRSSEEPVDRVRTDRSSGTRKAIGLAVTYLWVGVDECVVMFRHLLFCR